MKFSDDEIFWGLDVGTDSVGWAVTNDRYELIKFKGEPLWGSHVFEAGETKAKRRAFRTARRRLQRKKQRILLTQEIFAHEVAKVDPNFFIRIKESGLLREDASTGSANFFFNDADYTDKDFFRDDYPTIHHLICDLMKSTEPKDVRLVYLACAWLVKHRGHFLNEIDKDNIQNLTDFSAVFKGFKDALVEFYGSRPVEAEFIQFPEVPAEVLQEILRQRLSVTRKEALFRERINAGKKFNDSKDAPLSVAKVFTLLSGGRRKPAEIFPTADYAELKSISLDMEEEAFVEVVMEMDEMDATLLYTLRALYDWSLLVDALKGCTSISEAKVLVYEQHKADLAWLKSFVKKYLPKKYFAVFKDKASKENYVAYSGMEAENHCKKEAFCDYLKKLLKDVKVEDEDRTAYEEAYERILAYSFMPKQVDGDNRVIPYQLYYAELKAILNNARDYLPFLAAVDDDGYSNIDKLLSIFTFRVPYYVGPLRKDNSKNAWIERKAEGKIYPWNFSEMVDEDASEQAFINRMTNTCTYLPGEDVLPVNSLLYKKYTVLNEINNITVNDVKISVEAKQAIFEEFKHNKKVKVSRVKAILLSRGDMRQGDELRGIDTELPNLNANLSSYHAFGGFIKDGILTEAQVEEIITHATYSQDKVRMRKWLAANYKHLDEEKIKKILGARFVDFGRFSSRFLSGIEGVRKETGEITTIIQALWESNDNLMTILSDKYTFMEVIEAERADYYAGKDPNEMLDELLDEMYISNSVKRPIYRTLAILSDVRKATGKDPKRIFIEMARGGGKKKARTKKRRDTILDLYKTLPKDEVRELSHQLEGKTDNELQSERLYLYFMQQGRCMYSGEAIDINQLKTDRYDVDHIYPQCYVKDDSLSNKVLVKKELNGLKGEKFPIPAEVCNRAQMQPIWLALKNNGMMSDEKYRRLTRLTPFSEDEKLGFINRQLVETQQSTKALAEVLKLIYPDSEIVYVKAGLVSDFRKEFETLKCRSVNDLHHGKDAYLNIVCGNVYHCRFTKHFDVNRNYSLKTRTIFTQDVKENGEVIWHGRSQTGNKDDYGPDILRVKKIMQKNNLHYTRFVFEKKGELFDQNPLKKGKGAVPRKAGLSVEKYGGYNNTAASFFVLVEYAEIKGKGKKQRDEREVLLMPVELYRAAQVMESEEAFISYAENVIPEILGKSSNSIVIKGLPFGMRRLRINTKFKAKKEIVINQERKTITLYFCISGKSSGGEDILCRVMSPMILSQKYNDYIKKLEKAGEKMKNGVIAAVDESYDDISVAKNVDLYNALYEKLTNTPYELIYGRVKNTMKDGKGKFLELTLEEQVELLLNLVAVFKTGRAGGCDLRAIDGVKSAGIFTKKSKLSTWKNSFDDVRIVDESASGIFSKESRNLLELI